MPNVSIRIADIVFAVTGDGAPDPVEWEERYQRFFCQEDPDILVVGHFTGLSDITLSAEEKVYDSEAFWDVYKIDGHTTFVMRDPDADRTPYCIAKLDKNTQRADVYYSAMDLKTWHPLTYPLLHLLMLCFLAEGSGIIIHASGIAYDGKGLLFSGASGSGKTTMARLWESQGTVLCDERVVIRERNGRFWIYGTPWHGEHERFVNIGAPLERIFVLGLRGSNSIRPLEPGYATAQLLSQCLLPVWDQTGVSNTLEFFDRCLSAVPCAELSFVPNHSVVDFLH